MTAETVNAALVVLRVALGIVFVAHGAKHFVNREKTIAWAASIGLRRPGMQWFFMTFAEIGIGAGLLAGLLTSFAAAGLLSMMVGAFWTVHRHAGFFVTARPDEGYEYVFILAAAAFVVALLGPGEWSLDDALGIADDLDGTVGALIAAGGIVVGALQLAAFYRPGDQLSRGSSG